MYPSEEKNYIINISKIIYNKIKNISTIYKDFIEYDLNQIILNENKGEIKTTISYFYKVKKRFLSEDKINILIICITTYKFENTKFDNLLFNDKIIEKILKEDILKLIFPLTKDKLKELRLEKQKLKILDEVA